MTLKKSGHRLSRLLVWALLLFSPAVVAQEELGDIAYLPVHDVPPPLERYDGERSISTQLGDLQDFLQVNLLIQGDCPSEVYQKIAPTLAKDFNLLAASFVRAELEALSIWQIKLGYKKKSCQSALDQMWEQCQNSDEPIFSNQAKKIHQRLDQNSDAIEVDREIQSQLVRDIYKTPWGQRFPKRTQSNPVRDDVVKLSDQICHEDLQTIYRLCHSQFSVFGLSAIPWAEEELAHFYQVLGDKFQAHQQCLPRYVWENKKEEQIPQSFLLLLKNWGAWLAGERFPLGPLMGLKAVMLLQSEGKVSFEAEREIVLLDKTKQDELTPIYRPTPTAKAQLQALAIPTSTPQSVYHVSAFDQAYSLFQLKEQKEEIEVSAAQFRLDYPHLTKKAIALEEFLTPYQSQLALQKLKDQEGVGTEKAPMLLSFLKFFIDRNRHRVMFNVQSVLGSEFYVENDLIDDPYSVKVRLDFDQIEGWKLILIPH